MQTGGGVGIGEAYGFNVGHAGSLAGDFPAERRRPEPADRAVIPGIHRDLNKPRRHAANPMPRRRSVMNQPEGPAISVAVPETEAFLRAVGQGNGQGLGPESRPVRTSASDQVRSGRKGSAAKACHPAGPQGIRAKTDNGERHPSRNAGKIIRSVVSSSCPTRV